MNIKFLLVTLAALAVAIGAMLFLTRPPTPVANAAEAEESSASTLPPVAAAPAVAQARVETPVAPATKPFPSVLPTVNGVQITGKDLVPGGGEEAPPDATQEMLDRAIERELILQAATEAGVSLSEEQKQVLEDVATNIANRPAYRDRNDPQTQARMRAEIDFQTRETTAQLYLAALAAQPAATDALPGQGQATHSYLEGLRAGAKIEPGK
jgi:hypothetical protein